MRKKIITKSEVNKVFDENVGDIFAANRTRLQKAKASLGYRKRFDVDFLGLLCKNFEDTKNLLILKISKLGVKKTYSKLIFTVTKFYM